MGLLRDFVHGTVWPALSLPVQESTCLSLLSISEARALQRGVRGGADSHGCIRGDGSGKGVTGSNENNSGGETRYSAAGRNEKGWMGREGITSMAGEHQ